MKLDKEALDSIISAHKAYRSLQAAYYWDGDPVSQVSEFCTLDRLKEISEVACAPVTVGLRNIDGSPSEYAVEYNGCRFFAPANCAV